jgi:hypothetical protein
MDFESGLKLSQKQGAVFDSTFGKNEEISLKKKPNFFTEEETKKNVLRPLISAETIKPPTKSIPPPYTKKKAGPSILKGSAANDNRASLTRTRASLLNPTSENNTFAFPKMADNRASLTRNDKPSLLRKSQNQPFITGTNYRKKSSGHGLEIRASQSHTTGASTTTHNSYSHSILSKHGGRPFR